MHVSKSIQAAAAASRAGHSRGFTLIELMVAMVVSGIVLLGIFAFSSIQQGNAVIHRRHVRIQQALEGSMYSMSRDVRAAGLGFTRMCTEIRIYDPDQAKLINPGAVDDVSDAAIDPITGEPYWVLRDGLQAHWRSAGAASIDGDSFTSADPDAASDSFDVVLGERNYTNAMGVFALGVDATGLSAAANATLQVNGNALLDSTDADHLSQVRQLFPPGSFVLVARPLTPDVFRPQTQGQCVLLQVTDDVEAGPDPANWNIPIGNQSDFNKDLGLLFGDGSPTVCSGDYCDWVGSEALSGALVVPLGHLRWSRYEIDYSVPGQPYLVRSDIIGFLPGSDPTASAAEPYPDCPGNQCNLAQLHLPNNNGQAIPKVAIGPMIEDMQVAVGCDGFTQVSADALNFPPAPPAVDAGFGEKGDEDANLPNKLVDEWTTDKTNDEWLGNAQVEAWGPDCVYFGTGQRLAADWPVSGPASEQLAGPGFRLSPSTLRITLLGRSETRVAGNADDPNNEFYNQLFPIEDRPQMDTIAGGREYLTLTERFSPRNLRWRDPLLE